MSMLCLRTQGKVDGFGGLYFVRCVPADRESLRLSLPLSRDILPHHGYANGPGCKVVCVTVDGLVQIDGPHPGRCIRLLMDQSSQNQ